MSSSLNPFYENYITENTSPADFVDVFSPLHLNTLFDTQALFQPGNVVLTGVQGSGKSMLLALLKPDIRIAYSKTPETPFPVPKQHARFIGAGINLTKSGAADFGQRTFKPELEAERTNGHCFLAISSTIGSSVTISRHSKVGVEASEQTRRELGLDISPSKADRFASDLSLHRCWFGYLTGVSNTAELESRLTHRIQQYRAFLNYNGDIGSDIVDSKTTAGEPISIAADTLREAGVIGPDVQIYLRIDQYEELMHLEEWSRESGLYHDFRSIIHKMLARRDSRVSYRVGTRSYAWPDLPTIYGTTAAVEDLRNFRRIDLDELLRRQENRPWKFPDFANDVFTRRLKHHGYSPDSVAAVFGKPMADDAKARRYAGTNPERILKCEPNWPRRLLRY